VTDWMLTGPTTKSVILNASESSANKMNGKACHKNMDLNRIDKQRRIQAEISDKLEGETVCPRFHPK
jgi:hypothetical protein